MNKGGQMLCMGCMNDVDGPGICPFCGYDSNSGYDTNYIKPGTIIANRYIIGALKHRNGEGASYIGLDQTTDSCVWIREYFPYTIAHRDQKNGMILPNSGYGAQYKALMSDYVDTCNEVKRLSVSDPVVPIENVVGENNTIYAVYKNLNLLSLEEFLVAEGGKLPVDDALDLIIPLFNAMDNIHLRGVIHRGLSPFTVFVSKNRKIYIDNFALSATRTADSELQAELFNGYSAPEQYASNGWQGTWTDVYALAALLYRTVSGITPPKATLISPQKPLVSLSALVPGIAPQISEAVAHGMCTRTHDRTQTVAALTAEIMQEDTGSPSTTVYDTGRGDGYSPTSRRNDPSSSKREKAEDDQEDIPAKKGSSKMVSRAILIAVLAVVILVGVLLAVFISDNVLSGEDRSESITQPSLSTSQDTSSQPAVVSNDTSVLDGSVPNFVGQNWDDVRSNSDYTDRFVFEYEEITDKVAPQGEILQQTPSAGSPAQSKIVVKLTISKGNNTVVMPDLTGMTYEEAYAKLKALADEAGVDNLMVDKYERISETGTEGTVINTTPAAGTEVDFSTKSISIYVVKLYTASDSTVVSSESASTVRPSDSTVNSSKPSSASSASSKEPVYGPGGEIIDQGPY